jgi:hypothetical protein
MKNVNYILKVIFLKAGVSLVSISSQIYLLNCISVIEECAMVQREINVGDFSGRTADPCCHQNNTVQYHQDEGRLTLYSIDTLLL